MREKRKCPFCGKEMICVNAQDGEFTCTTCAEYANHDVLDFIEKLQAENERLKAELQQSATNRNKLRCLALHAMSQYYGYKSLFSSRKKTHRIKYGQFSNKFYEAYRNAKKALKEGK